jgi:hypothetical protein
MEPEFQHMLVRVLLVGGTIIAAGATALFFAFRAFEKPSSSRAFIWLMGICFVILIVCAILWRVSYGD